MTDIIEEAEKSIQAHLKAVRLKIERTLYPTCTSNAHIESLLEHFRQVESELKIITAEKQAQDSRFKYYDPQGWEEAQEQKTGFYKRKEPSP